MAVQCLSQQVQVYVLIALDLRQAQHCERCATALCNLSGSRSRVARGRHKAMPIEVLQQPNSCQVASDTSESSTKDSKLDDHLWLLTCSGTTRVQDGYTDNKTAEHTVDMLSEQCGHRLKEGLTSAMSSSCRSKGYGAK